MNASGSSHDDKGVTHVLKSSGSGEMQLVTTGREDPAVIEDTLGSSAIQDQALKAYHARKFN